jgi:hypothetical protein
MFQYSKHSSLLSPGRKLTKLTPLKSQDNVAIIFPADGKHLNFPSFRMSCGTIPLTSAWIWIQIVDEGSIPHENMRQEALASSRLLWNYSNKQVHVW